MNAFWEPLDFELPNPPDREPWRRWIDTSLDSPDDIISWQTAAVVTDPSSYHVGPLDRGAVAVSEERPGRRVNRMDIPQPVGSPRSRRGRRFTLACVMLGALLPGPTARAQRGAGTPATPSAQAAPARDPLGRETPRGTVLAFMNAARNGRDQVSPLYLNTPLRDREALDLAHKLFQVLDSRLSPRLNELSDRPEGSLANPLRPDQDIVGTIATVNGTIDLVLERVNRGALGPVWLFSRETLALIPGVYDDVDLVVVDRFLPDFLTRPRVAGIRLFAWLVLLLVVPVGYHLTGFLGRLLRPVVAGWRRRRGQAGETPADLVPGFVRLLLLAVLIRWLLGIIEIRLPERVFWSGIAASLTVGGIVWALLLLNGAAERSIHRRLRTSGRREIAAILRLVRRVADALVIAAAGLAALHYFGVNPTAALAGLGIGGIAVALAAQKTLENVIGGLSIIFDRALSVGDSVKLGDTLGTVDYIGLRSTRIRTLDRTILTVPNGQIATVNIETLSARDKFWVHHIVALRLDTTTSQMRTTIEGIRHHLIGHLSVDRREPIRVRFFRFGEFSLDIDVFAYVFARDWDAFLETQQDLLLEIMGIVERSGAKIALPSRTLHMADAREDRSDAVRRPSPGESPNHATVPSR